MTPEKLAEAGAALYGPNFVGPLADACKLTKRTLRRWLRDGAVVPPFVGVEISLLCRKRSEELLLKAHEISADEVAREPWGPE